MFVLCIKLDSSDTARKQQLQEDPGYETQIELEWQKDHKRSNGGKNGNERKAASTRPQHVNIFGRMLRRSPKRCGAVVFIFLACFYIADFYQLSPYAANDQTSLPISDSVKVSQPSAKFMGSQKDKRETVYTLPGAINDDGETFQSGSSSSTQRDPNQLPGAIGSDGAFDDYESGRVNGPAKRKSKTTPSAVQKGVKSFKNQEEPSKARKAAALAKTELKESQPGVASKPLKKTRHRVNEKLVSNTRKKSGLKRNTVPKKERAPSKPASGDMLVSSASSPKESSQEPKNSSIPNETNDEISSSADTGPHPMNRNIEELQVPGGTGPLGEAEVRSTYAKLVKAYLAPFASGIKRRSFFEIMRRKTYSLTPPGANKGIQTILFQIVDKNLYLMDPYEVAKNSKPFYKTRIKELIWLLSEVAKEGKVPDTEFLLAIHDCVQTVRSKHTYRGAVFKESNPTFTIVSCNFSDNIPFPMWEGDEVRGGLKSWDEKMEKYRGGDKTPWAEKKDLAVFRGGNRPSMFFQKKVDANEHCDEVGRSRLRYLGESNPELFDVGVGGTCGGKTQRLSRLSEAEHHNYKYILYAEGNCFWADRLNKQVFGPSAIIKQETPCGQFWEPLLRPMTHYIPTDFFFQDTMDKINWARKNDEKVRGIVKNANEFASNFLSVKGIKTYVEVLLLEYSKLLATPKITREKGSKKVTV